MDTKDQISQAPQTEAEFDALLAAPAGFTLPYRASVATQWISNPNAMNPTTGNIDAGDMVLLRQDFDTVNQPTWSAAKYGDRVCYVHGADFKKGCA